MNLAPLSPALGSNSRSKSTDFRLLFAIRLRHGPVDQLPYGEGGQIDGEGELNLRCRDVEACSNRRQRGLVHGEREGADRNERGDQPLSARTRSKRRRLDLPTLGLIGGALDGPFRLENWRDRRVGAGARPVALKRA